MTAARIDFLRPRRIPWAGVCLLALGSAALLGALWLDRHWAAQRAEREAATRAQEEAADRARREALRPIPLSPDQRRLQRIAPALRQPWLPTLRVIENVTEPPVYLLSMAIDPAAGTIRLDAEAPSFDHALAYVQLLDEGGLLGPAQIHSHEQGNDPARPAVRFTVVTRWSTK
jgi:hypothetical protein